MEICDFALMISLVFFKIWSLCLGFWVSDLFREELKVLAEPKKYKKIEKHKFKIKNSSSAQILSFFTIHYT